MVTMQFDQNEMRKLMAKIDKLANIDSIAQREIIEAAESNAQIYVSAAKSRIRDYHKDIIVVKKNGTRLVIPRGTLRRSMGTWRPKGTKSMVMAGPRTRSLGKSVGEDSDGWFAGIVEGGLFGPKFGGRKTTANTGVFEKTKANVASRIQSNMRNDMLDIINNVAKR
jgi:hypothetical protein